MKFLLILLLFVPATFAQDYKRISWRPDSKCWSKGLVEDRIKCDFLVQNNNDIHIIKYDDLTVAASLFYDGEYFIVDVLVQNGGKERILVDRDTPIFSFWKTEDLSDKGEILTPIPPEKIVKKIQNRIFWANALGAIGAGMQTKTSQADVLITDNRGNVATGTITTTEQDKSAQKQEAERAWKRADQANVTGNAILDGALKSNTLLENQFTSGSVYFKRNKKAKFAIYTMKLGDILFDFPIRYNIK